LKGNEKVMKKILSLIILSFFMFSCKSVSNKSGDFNLLPLPLQFEITGSSSLSYKSVKTYFSHGDVDLSVLGDLLQNIKSVDEESKAQIVYSIDNSIDTKAEGYNLDISDQQITIVGKDKAGLFYGFKTLEQLLQDAKEQNVYLPLCNIVDYSSLAFRAIHLDIKHHIDNTDYYYDLMDMLAGYKINGIIVELEDKLKYERQPIVGAGDALTIEQWQELSNYAKERNIEISPLVQGLGHAAFILKHDKYKLLRDDPEKHWAFNPLDPETYKVQFDLYLDAIEATPHGKYLHIGGDEVHTTGRNSGKSPLELQMMWLAKVCEFAEQHNRTPIFWDDMPLKHAGVYRPMFDTNMTEEQVNQVWRKNEHKLAKFLDSFPQNCIYMRWNYSSPQAIGNSKAMQWFRKNGLQVMGATAGQTRWVLMPQNESNIDNIKSFAVSSIESDLNGLLLTLWDDDSPHFELYKRGIVSFAEYTWTGDKRTKSEIKSAYRHRQFSNDCAAPEMAFIDQLEGPVAFWKNSLLLGNRRNYLKFEKIPTAVVIDLPDPDGKGEWSKKHAERLEKARATKEDCDAIAAKISTVKQKANRNHYTLQVYEQVNNLVSFTMNALLSLKEYDDAQNEQEELAAKKKIQDLSKEFAAVRNQMESVYRKTRNLTKPADYILDQYHSHVHLASMTISFDWQFYAEMLFLEKINEMF
jgi:hexosaminidase